MDLISFCCYLCLIDSYSWLEPLRSNLFIDLTERVSATVGPRYKIKNENKQAASNPLTIVLIGLLMVSKT